jgi:hypothetical protein
LARVAFTVDAFAVDFLLEDRFEDFEVLLSRELDASDRLEAVLLTSSPRIKSITVLALKRPTLFSVLTNPSPEHKTKIMF